MFLSVKDDKLRENNNFFLKYSHVKLIQFRFIAKFIWYGPTRHSSRKHKVKCIHLHLHSHSHTILLLCAILQNEISQIDTNLHAQSRFNDKMNWPQSEINENEHDSYDQFVRRCKVHHSFSCNKFLRVNNYNRGTLLSHKKQRKTKTKTKNNEAVIHSFRMKWFNIYTAITNFPNAWQKVEFAVHIDFFSVWLTVKKIYLSPRFTQHPQFVNEFPDHGNICQWYYSQFNTWIKSNILVSKELCQ